MIEMSTRRGETNFRGTENQNTDRNKALANLESELLNQRGFDGKVQITSGSKLRNAKEKVTTPKRYFKPVPVYYARMRSKNNLLN